MPRPQLRLRLILAIIGTLVILQLVIPNRAWLMILIILASLLLLCFFWTRRLAQCLHLERDMRFGWTQVGDRLEERYRLINTSNLPVLWIEVQDHSNMPDYDTSRGTGISGLSQVEWRTQGSCRHRGVFTLGPTSLHTGDPFGLFVVQLDFPSTRDIMVVPPIIPLPAIDVAPGGRFGEGRSRPNALERTVSVAGVREYLHGDSLRWIHWPTSAHRNSLYVRLFDSTPASDVWIILDMDERVQSGSGEDSTEEHGITLAASLADQYLREGKSVGFVTHGHDLTWLVPRMGEEQRWAILRAMAQLNPGTVPLDALLARLRQGLSKSSSLIIITSGIQEPWIQEMMLLARGGAIPTILIVEATKTAMRRGQNDGAEQSTTGTTLLSDLGVRHYFIPADIFSRPEAKPGHLGEWNLRILPTGRVISISEPTEDQWQALS